MRRTFVLQILGWTSVAALDLAMSRAAMPEGDVGWAVYEAGSLGLGGLAISSALLWIYLTRWPARGSTGGVAALAGALAGGAALYVGLNLLDRAVEFPYRQPLAEGLFGRGMLYFFIMLAWHAAFAAARASARAADAERLAQQARLHALRCQLNPHFLFNALNSAIALIDEDPQRAQTMLTLLSGLLRKTLEDDTAAETTLRQELDLIHSYMEIQRVRYEERLRVEIDVPDAVRDCAVPPLLLHALVENAVKHGLRTASTTPVEISVVASYDGDALHIEVRNSGRLERGSNGLGLRNLTDRLDTLYPGRHRFDIAEKNGEVCAMLEIRGPKVSG